MCNAFTQRNRPLCILVIRNSELHQRFIQHVVDFVVAQRLLEVVRVGLLVNLDVLDAQHLGEVLPVLLGDVVREG